MILIGGNTYELVKENKNGWNLEAFRERYSEVLDRYDYIVGDWGYSQLRLKGFFKEENHKGNKESSIAVLHDYLNEYCNFGCAYFIVERTSARQVKADEKPEGGEKGERPNRYERHERPPKPERPERPERERTARDNRGDKPEQPNRSDRGPRGDRGDRGGDRGDRPDRNDRQGRGHGGRNHSGGKGGPSDKGGGNQPPNKGNPDKAV